MEANNAGQLDHEQIKNLLTQLTDSNNPEQLSNLLAAQKLIDS
jgi:hypothetical protein